MKRNHALIVLGILIVAVVGYYVYSTGNDEPQPDQQLTPDVLLPEPEMPDERYFDDLVSEREVLELRSREMNGELAIGGIVPEPFTDNDYIVAYVQTDEWWIQPDSENYFTPIDRDGYFQLLAQPGSDIVLFVVSTREIDFPMTISTAQQLPKPDGIFIMEAFRKSLDVVM